MNRTAFAIVFAGATLVLGVFNPSLVADARHAWINLPWSVVDGLGAFAIDKTHPGLGTLHGPVPDAVLLWPLIVATIAFVSVRFGVNSSKVGWTHPAVMLLIVSALVWTPYSFAEHRLKADDPTWLSYYLAGY